MIEGRFLSALDFVACGHVQLAQTVLQKFDTLLAKSRFPRPGLLMNSRTYLSF